MSTKNITKTISKILNELCEQKKDKDYTSHYNRYGAQ